MPPNDASEDYSMRMFNSDGSEPEMCGNGIRCLARFVSDLDAMPPKKYKVGTLAGLIQPEMRADGQVAVDMGMPILSRAKSRRRSRRPKTVRLCARRWTWTVRSG